MDGCMAAWRHDGMDAWMDGWIHGWMDGWMDGCSENTPQHDSTFEVLKLLEPGSI